MQFYRTTNTDTNPTTVLQFDGTMKDAHDSVKQINKSLWPTIRVELVDLNTDKEGMLYILNGGEDFSVLKTWKMTPRGGLADCANGE